MRKRKPDGDTLFDMGSATTSSNAEAIGGVEKTPEPAPVPTGGKMRLSDFVENPDNPQTITDQAFDRLLGKESMGGGDIKLFFMTSLYLGLLQGLFSLILSCIVGLVIAAVMRRKRVPFGPAISLAAFLSLLYGESFVNWYLSLIM